MDDSSCMQMMHTVLVLWTRRDSGFDGAVFNCKWMDAIDVCRFFPLRLLTRVIRAHSNQYHRRQMRISTWKSHIHIWVPRHICIYHQFIALAAQHAINVYTKNSMHNYANATASVECISPSRSHGGSLSISLTLRFRWRFHFYMCNPKLACCCAVWTMTAHASLLAS